MFISLSTRQCQSKQYLNSDFASYLPSSELIVFKITMSVHLNTCLKISRSLSIGTNHNLKQKIFRNRFGVPFSLHCSNFRFVRCGSSASSYIQESPFGSVDVPNVSLPNFIFKDIGQWTDKPMIVSIEYVPYRTDQLSIGPVYPH